MLVNGERILKNMVLNINQQKFSDELRSIRHSTRGLAQSFDSFHSHSTRGLVLSLNSHSARGWYGVFNSHATRGFWFRRRFSTRGLVQRF